ncbi:MAG: LysR family transcriptional regulator [Pseudomonadota bacterium]
MSQILDWDHLRVFLAAHRAGSLRGASEALHVNHATIRRALAGLEEALGTRVFDRGASGLSLTHPGEELLAHAEEMERQATRLTRKLSGLDAKPSGTIRLSLPPSFAQGFLAPILASFSEAYPDIQVRVIATNKITDLARHEADVSIRIAYKVEDDVVGRRLFHYVTAAFATPAYLAAHPDLQATGGEGAHWIGWGRDTAWIRESPFPRARARHALPEIFMQLEAAANNMGMAYVPAFFGDLDPRLQRIPGTPVLENRSVWLLLHGDLRNTARVRAFVDHAADYLLRHRKAFTE